MPKNEFIHWTTLGFDKAAIGRMVLAGVLEMHPDDQALVRWVRPN
jgi:hypothetical protein